MPEKPWRINQAVNHLEAVLEEHARVGLGGDGDAQQTLVQAMHFVEAHTGRPMESRRVLLGEISYDELHWGDAPAMSEEDR